MKIFWLVSLIILVAILFVLAGYILIGNIAYNRCLNRNGKYKKSIQKNIQNHPQNLFAEEVERVEIKSHDNLKLRGIFKQMGGEKLAILVHGYGGNCHQMEPYAKIFATRNYDILAIDLRCHGKSEGDDITMGENESKDLMLWVNKMLERNPQYKIILFGISMGATSICLACGNQLPQNVVLAIEDCGFSNAYNQLAHVYFKSKMAIKPIFKIFYSYTKRTKNFDLKKVDGVKALQKCKIPMLFIHGENDDFVPTENLKTLSSQLPETRKETYIAPNSAHVQSYLNNPKSYTKVVENFLSKYYM